MSTRTVRWSGAESKLKTKTTVLILIAAFTILLFLNQTAYAQSSQVSSIVNLTHLNVQLTYPSQVQPGQSVIVNVQAKAKGSFKLGSLTMQIYVPGQNNLRQVTSVTVADGLSMLTGDQINKNIQVTVPQDTPRTNLIAKLSENVTLTIFIIYNNASPSVQPAPYYTTISDDAITPLTYVMATTPEYSSLQSQFQALQTNFIQLQKTLNDTKTNLENTISQQNATINQLNEQFNEQLTYENRRVQTYQGLSIGLGFVTVALAILCVYLKTSRHGTKAAVESVASTNPTQPAEARESKPKRKFNLKKISIAAVVILFIVITSWMTAAYYSNASSATQTHPNATDTTSQRSITTNTNATMTGRTNTTTTGKPSHTSATAAIKPQERVVNTRATPTRISSLPTTGTITIDSRLYPALVS